MLSSKIRLTFLTLLRAAGRERLFDIFNNLWFNENEMIQALLPFFSVYTYIIVRKGQRRFMI